MDEAVTEVRDAGMHDPQDAVIDDPLEDVRRWRADMVRWNDFECTPIPFAESEQWRFQDGYLRHETGRFFYLSGVKAEARHPGIDGHEQLIIVQHRIGINGFLIRDGVDGVDVLFKGNVEPGTVFGMQLTPTVQVTRCNYERAHGGQMPPFVEWFLEPGRGEAIYEAPQSEEATRYHGKYNRNSVVRVPRGAAVESSPAYRWYGLDAIRRLVASNNTLNTDARSVLACMDWDVLTGRGEPFAGHSQGSFGADLHASYTATEEDAEQSDADVLTWLMTARVHCGLRTRIIPLHDLRNWVVEADCIRERERELGFRARQFRVVARHREVGHWDQPLIDSDGVGRVVLVCQKRRGVLHVLVKASREIGYFEGVQLTASVVVPPGEAGFGDDPVQRALAGLMADPELSLIHI